MNGSTSIAWTTALVFCFMLMSQGAKPKRRIEFTKIECTNMYPKIVKVNCTLENFSEISADIELFEDISELRGNYTLSVNHGNHTFPYVSQEIDYCTALLNVHKQPMVQMMVSEIRRASNISLNCPWKKNTSFYVRDFKVDYKLIPRYMPKMAFHTVATYISYKKEILRVETFGQLGI